MLFGLTFTSLSTLLPWYWRSWFVCKGSYWHVTLKDPWPLNLRAVCTCMSRAGFPTVMGPYFIPSHSLIFSCLPWVWGDPYIILDVIFVQFHLLCCLNPPGCIFEVFNSIDVKQFIIVFLELEACSKLKLILWAVVISDLLFDDCYGWKTYDINIISIFIEYMNNVISQNHL